MPQFAGARFTDIPEDHPAFGNVQGVLVADAAPGSPAWRFGLRRGDILLAVNRKPVGSVAQLETVARGVVRVVALNVLRGGTELFLAMR